MQPERVSELADLLERARSARAGLGNAVLVRSASGMRCSALLGEVAARVRRLGSVVLSLSCSPSDAHSRLAVVGWCTGTCPRRTGALHMRSARRLDDLGAPLPQVAEHLLQADVAQDAWACGVLHLN